MTPVDWMTEACQVMLLHVEIIGGSDVYEVGRCWNSQKMTENSWDYKISIENIWYHKM